MTRIGYSAFSHCTRLISVTVPPSVTYINNRAFGGCTSLTHITLPGVTYVSWDAFSKCPNLTEITLTGEIKSRSEYFWKTISETCPTLISVTLAGPLTEIGYEAFRGFTSLGSITIPDTVG